jgi:hypothetical protein
MRLKGCCGLGCPLRSKKNNLKILVFVKIWSFFKKKTHKSANFRYFFFDPTLFLVEKLPIAAKITTVIPNDKSVSQNNFHNILVRIGDPYMPHIRSGVK